MTNGQERQGWIFPPPERDVRFYALLGIPLLGAAGAVLIAENQFELLPALLLPILAFRLVLSVHRRIEGLAYDTVVTLSHMLRRAHVPTSNHVDRVADWAELTALECGLSPARAREVREAARLHDIGKIAIDEAILDKPARLTESEYAHVRNHAEFGAEILAESGFLKRLSNWIRYHHERPDGRGYPKGLRHDQIPLESSIIAVVDAFDAMVGDSLEGERRPYRERMTVDQALAELESCAGTQFDPVVVSTFCRLVRRYQGIVS